MGLVRCQQPNCRQECDGTRTVNGKVACIDCVKTDQERQKLAKWKQQHRPTNWDDGIAQR